VKLALAAMGGALGASACCIGPVLFSLMGAGALGAASARLEPYRPWFTGFTALIVGLTFYAAYRPAALQTCEDGACTPPLKRTAKWLAWIVAAIAVLLIAFPYYVGLFV